MIQYVILAGLISVSFTAARIPRLDGRIVGGVDAAIEDHPHQASLQNAGAHTCGASIIARDFAVTAAHCTDGADPILLTLRVGTSTKGRGGEVLQVDRIFQHPLFGIESMDYDIAILRLGTTLDFTTSVGPIALADETTRIKSGSFLTVTGWGALEEGGSSVERLQAVQVPYVDWETCKREYEGEIVTERMICAGNVDEGGKDSCQGDSGGPLVQDGILVGIVSWGEGCGRPLFPGVYSSVSELRGFIRNVTDF